MNRIDPVRSLARELSSVQNPVRYLGGEYGQIVKKSADLTFAIAFPDLYEIAMSNLAVKIIYDGLNRIPSIRCERVFAPAPDFETLLKSRRIPLYTLESGIPLGNVDIVGVSLGYEPGINGLLSILDTGGIPLLRSERGEGDPVVLAGGCGITNPAPFASFIDAFFIGEAEAGLFALMEEVAAIKRKGAKRADIIDLIAAHPSVWTAEKDAAALTATALGSPAAGNPRGRVVARRAVYAGFGSASDRAVCFPIPNFRVVQDHGAVEIMRGCPNGCRFCHAGLYYRPQRMKPFDRILADVEYLVNAGGHREVSLMSLSSGDYEGIDRLMTELTAAYADRNVSFQLPSLKVNTFTLPLLEKMAEVRKSGLTFAVETPVDAWQLSLNKEVNRDRIIDIMLEAKRRGWSGAKFYFMIGLPVERGGQREEVEIVDFLLEIQERTRMQVNANIGTFIPKPHTPYQWSHQLSIDEANLKLDYIHRSLPRGRFKLSTHHPFNSLIEGMMSRGDARVGDIILEAYKRGCRLDAWDDHAKPDVWKAVMAEAPWDVEAETIRERDLGEALPWDGISLGATKEFLKREKKRSDEGILTGRCDNPCAEACGTCGKDVEVKKIETPQESPALRPSEPRTVTPARQATHRVIVTFAKIGSAAYIPHLGLLETWHKAFQRSCLPVMFSEGFNPLPRFEIAHSLSLGISSDGEIASFLLYEARDDGDIRSALERSLPASLAIRDVFSYPLSLKIKRESLSKYLWGGRYRYSAYDASIGSSVVQSILSDSRTSGFISANPGVALEDTSDSGFVARLPFAADRPFRDLLALIVGKPVLEVMGIHKLESIARDEKTGNPVGFPELFRIVAEQNTSLLDLT